MRNQRVISGMLVVIGLSVLPCGLARLAHGDSLPQDIYVRETDGRIEFGNGAVRLTFDRVTGRWTGLFAEGVAGNMIRPAEAPAMDFTVGGVTVCQSGRAALRRWQTRTDDTDRQVHLELAFAVAVGAKRGDGASDAYEVTCEYALYGGQSRVDRSMRVRRVHGDGESDKAVRFEGFAYAVPGAVVGDPQDCVVDAPGPYWPKTYLRPETPYRSLREVKRRFHSAPDAGFGLLAITNETLDMTLASWMDTAGDVNYRSSLRGDGRRVTLEHGDERAYRLQGGQTVCSDTHRLEIVRGGLPAALARYREMCERRMPLDERTPTWAREMILLEAYLPYYPGGFKELADRLPFYREIGFNTLYLMPHWVGGYSPIDLYAVDPRFGTAEDLKDFVARAHAVGMRVLFDMVIHGFNEKSLVPRQRPELFVRNEDGSLARHRTWKSITTDWAAPAYRQYMVDLVVHDLKTYDIDGYRVDAASYKGPSWDPNLPYPAYRSGSDAPKLMKAMLGAMREIKPDAVLLSEVFGPVFYSVCNLVHDNQTEGPQYFLEQMEAGQANARDYKSHMANVFDALPRGANRVYYARNHDTSWFYHFNGYTRRFMALEAIHALCAIPEIFAGDPRNGPHPDTDPAVYDTYQKLFAVRKEFPEIARGELLLRKVEGDNPKVFTALRQLESKLVLVVISLSEKSERVIIRLSSEANAEAGRGSITWRDPLTGEATTTTGGTELELTLHPFQVLLGRL
jgi:glycosidase